MKSWFELSTSQSGRTTTGLSPLEPAQIPELFEAFLTDSLRPDRFPGIAGHLRRAAEDLKAYYFEALSAHPSQSTDPQSLANWFWGKTAAAQLIYQVSQKCLEYESKELQITGKLLLVPRNQLHRFV